MNEDFVSFELAKKLKEKGYPMTEIPTGGIDNRPSPVLYDLPKEHPNWQDCKAWWVPTISQVLKWLREVKRIDSGAIWDNRDGKWVGYVSEMDIPDLAGQYVLPNTYDTYEATTFAGIEYVLDKLI